jgi:Zn-dependent protease with chaperone function
MDDARFDAIVARLEVESREAPGRYRLKVAALALAGFGLLFLLMGGALAGILALVGIGIAIVLSGGKAALLLAKVGKFLWVLIVPLWLLLKSSVSALFTRLPPPEGLEIGRDQAPALFAALDDMRARMGGPRFHQVLLTMEMNAAVVQRPAFGLAGFPRNHLILGMPLLESLSPDEALSVVAHEYGHLAGSHGHFGAWIYRLRNTWATISELSQQWTGWGGQGLRRLVRAYAPYFNAYTWVLARANEYQADAASAELGSAATAANALKRVNLAAARYDGFLSATYATVSFAPAPPADIAARWAAEATTLPPAAQAQGWLRDSLGREKRHHDTHPVLRDRLAALPGQADHVEELPPPLTGPSAADAWLGASASSLRDQLQAGWVAEIEPGWRQRHGEIEARRQRLAELRAQADPAPDDTLERLRLQVELEPDTDSLPAVAAFNAANADEPGGLYLEGALRLNRDDAHGVALLERAMALDAECTTGACERIHHFLAARGDQAGADRYARRWRERRALEDARYEQYHSFDPRHEVVVADLDDEQMQMVRTIIGARRRGMARAWVVRRILPADPSIRTYVVCVDPAWWMRLLGRSPRIIDALNEASWPMPTYLCALVGEPRKHLRSRLDAMPEALVYP